MKQNELKKPFFAAFLENQVKENEARRIQGGATATSVATDMAETQKYPSDQEDGITNVDWDCILTQKYPSDNDEAETM